MAIFVMSIISIVWSVLWFLVGVGESYDIEIVSGCLILVVMFTIAQSIVGIVQGSKLKKLEKASNLEK